MIRKIELNNFKCFENNEFELSNLNLFSGTNSMGKSTVLQALLLLRQSFEIDNKINKAYLNGQYVNLGGVKDLLTADSDAEEIVVKITADEGWLEYRIPVSKELELDVVEVVLSGDEMTKLNLFIPGFDYISAERFGPRLIYEKSSNVVSQEKRLGVHGEYFVHYLQKYGETEDVKNNEVLHPDEKSTKLKYQVIKWMSEITEGFDVDFENYGRSNTVGFAIHQNEGNNAHYFTPNNVGFGISYVLPVITALLKAKCGDLVIIENPEAHLHPRGQRKIGELISCAAAGGVQIIIETHSDHILNGIRLSVMNEAVSPDSVNLFFISKKDKKTGSSRIIEKPKIEKNGKIQNWPKGFFDEWDYALFKLM
ncbi:MAG: DUF3696 domain-containing protein [Lachnospiraceae bacterium]|nr:DUF3696 domain-containing protein [Lachnospiraceae bacterium]